MLGIYLRGHLIKIVIPIRKELRIPHVQRVFLLITNMLLYLLLISVSLMRKYMIAIMWK